MRVLVVGSGAREHAIVTALLADAAVSEVVAAPGNAGIARDVRTAQVDVADPAAVAELAVSLGVDLAVIGPEVPLVMGAADAIRARGIACFGPSKRAAQLEGSKAFAKEVMTAAGVATARASVCQSLAEVSEALARFGAPHVVKDDGLAAGKGVVVTSDYDDAIDHAAKCLVRSGGRVVVEEYLDGPEVSLFGITDGVTVVPLQPAQDFKRVGDGDRGPNTGGMGAYSPLSWAPSGLVADVAREVLTPMVDAMAARGTPFCGLLYAGLALTADGVRVIEFNARFGDPETQVVLANLRTPLGGLLYAAATGGLAAFPALQWWPGYAVTVVIAAAGYPDQPRGGDVITGIDVAERSGVQVFHAGTALDDGGRVVSSGGRVLSVTARADTLSGARSEAYAAVDLIALEGSHHRRDIAAAASAAVGDERMMS